MKRFPSISLRLLLYTIVGLLVLCVYGTILHTNVRTEGLFRYVFVDFQVWWAAAKAQSSLGYDAVYDTSIIQTYQAVFDKEYLSVIRPTEITVLPYAYPPFTLPILTLIPVEDLWVSFIKVQGVITLLSIFGILFALGSLWFLRGKDGAINSETLQTSILVLCSLQFLNGIIVTNPSAILMIPASCLLMANRFPLFSGILASALWVKPNLAGLITVLLLLLGPRRVGFGMLIGVTLLCIIGTFTIGKISTWEAWLQLVLNYSENWGGWPRFQPTVRMLATRIAETIFEGGSLLFYGIFVLALATPLYAYGKRVTRTDEGYAIWFLKLICFAVVINTHSQLHSWLLVAPFFIALSTSTSFRVQTYSLLFFGAPILLHMMMIFLGFNLGDVHLTSSVLIVLIAVLIIFDRFNLAPQIESDTDSKRST